MELRPEQLSIRVDPERDHLRGPLGAEHVLVVFSDFECPFCASAARSIEEVRARLGERLLVVFRHFPLEEIHPHARLAAEAAEAAGAQGRFWEFHDRLFAHQAALGREDLVAHAAALGLDVEQFALELDGETYADVVARQAQGGSWIGVTGTPALFLDDARYTGAYDPAALEAALLLPRGV